LPILVTPDMEKAIIETLNLLLLNFERICMVMADEKKPWDQDTFDQKMKDSLNELSSLRIELQNLLVKFGLRALKQYQAARNYPLRANEINRLVKYEIDNAIMDVSETESKDAIIKQTRIEWEKKHKVEK
jgi:hypothetical protein